ncbi:MAG TPA: hypothetical protein VKA15_00070 [Isosphaeraceae bacterium]|nr:hypothetical protein [Isosphaeraceae bacterium]
MRSDKRPDPARSREALKAQLRALPQPPVPAHLEALLLATVPRAKTISPRRWAVRATVIGVASAACAIAVLIGLPHQGKNHSTIPLQGEPARPDNRRPAFESISIAAWREDPRLLDDEKLPAFTWPVDETAIPRASTSIPADLLD